MAHGNTTVKKAPRRGPRTRVIKIAKKMNRTKEAMQAHGQMASLLSDLVYQPLYYGGVYAGKPYRFGGLFGHDPEKARAKLKELQLFFSRISRRQRFVLQESTACPESII